MVEMVENNFEISAPNPNCGNGGNGPNGGNHFRFGPQPQWWKWWNWWQSLEISPLPHWWKWWKSFRFSHNPNGGENGVNHSWDLAPIPIGEIVEIVELQIWPQPQRWNCWKWWKSFQICPQTQWWKWWKSLLGWHPNHMLAPNPHAKTRNCAPPPQKPSVQQLEFSILSKRPPLIFR